MSRFTKFLTLILIVFGVMSTPASSNESIRLTIGEWPPYFSKELKHDGVVSHVVQRVFKLSGVNVQFGYFPWRRSLMLATNGVWDGTVGWHKNPKREKIFYISDPLFYDISVVFHLKKKFIKFKKLEDLKGLRAGLIMGYEYKVIGPLVKKGIVKASYVPREVLAFKMLLHERFDFFPLSMDVGNAILQSKFTEKERNLIKYQVVPNKSHFPLYLMLYKNEKTKVLIKKFNKGFKKLKKSGEYDKLWRNSRKGKYLLK